MRAATEADGVCFSSTTSSDGGADHDRRAGSGEDVGALPAGFQLARSLLPASSDLETRLPWAVWFVVWLSFAGGISPALVGERR